MTIILKDDNDNILPQEVQDKINNFIDNLPKINWFKPPINLKRKDIEKQAELTLKCFGIKAQIEYIKILNQEDWDLIHTLIYTSAWKSARTSVWDLIWNLAKNSTQNSTLNSVSTSTWDSTWNSIINSNHILTTASTRALARATALDLIRASQEILIEDNTAFNRKYPQGAFKQLFRLWEMGLYPAGILKNTKKFTIYIPPSLVEFSEDFK